MTENNRFNETIVAIIRGVTPAEVVDVASAILDAGITCIEVPLNSPDAFSSIAILAEKFGHNVLIGAGTVLTADDAEKVRAAGGQLVVSPNTDVSVIKRTKELGMISLPGFATATEGFSAIGAGADGLKLFPAGSQGAATIKALKAVLPSHIPLLAVGGVGPKNMAEFVKNGADGFGLGTSLYQPGMSVEDVAKNAADSVEAYKRASSGV